MTQFQFGPSHAKQPSPSQRTPRSPDASLTPARRLPIGAGLFGERL